METLDVIALRLRFRRLKNTIAQIEIQIERTLDHDPITNADLDLCELQMQTRDYFIDELGEVVVKLRSVSFANWVREDEGEKAFKERMRRWMDCHYKYQ